MSEYYTQEERKGMIGVLRSARKRISDQKEIYVCHAVTSVRKKPRVGRYAILTESYIDNLLGVYTLDQWLVENHGINRKSCDALQYYEKMRATRLAWIDNMIKELS